MLVVFFVLAALFIYFHISERERKNCLEFLESSSNIICSDIDKEIKHNFYYLKVIADSMVAENTVYNYDVIASHTKNIQPLTIFSRIDILYPDGTVLTQNKEILQEKTDFKSKDFSENYIISPRTFDRMQKDENIVYFEVPAMKNKKVVAIVQGVFSCDNPESLLSTEIYNGKSTVCIVDRRDGNFIVDKWHRNLGNIFAFQPRKPMKGYENRLLKNEVANGHSGTTAYYSQANDDNSYMHYEPIGKTGWMLLIVAQEQTVFHQAKTLFRDFIVSGIIFFIIIIVNFSKNVMAILIISQQNDALEQKSATDSLTGCKNRFALSWAYNGHFDKSSSIGLIELDLNGLKTVNDNDGHAAGDALICSAAKVLTETFTKENVYRVGGDEFIVAVLNATKQDFEDSINRLSNLCIRENVSFALGSFFNEKFNVSFEALLKIVDKRMYESKDAYYRNSGLDRRGQRAAYTALNKLYTKILKINLTKDSFKIIRMTDEERSLTCGFTESISSWLENFAESGMVHKDDKEEFLRKTNLRYLRNYFKTATRAFTIIYRRKINEKYAKSVLEIVPAEDYMDDSQNLYLYVRELDE